MSETLCSPFPPGPVARRGWLAPNSPDPVHGAGGDPEFGATSLIRCLDFAHLRSIVFARMLPKIANDWRREEVEALMTGAGLEDVQLAWVNEISWAATGRRPQGENPGGHRSKVPKVTGVNQRSESGSPLLLTAGILG
ncbi:hypothetical protein [Azospirillum melinis]